MLLPTRPPAPRRGLSLLEVLVALAIFLLSFVALGKLVTLSSDQAVEVQYQSQATHMAQSKLNEVVSGALPLSSQSGSIDEDSEWQWSIETEQTGDVASLWTVHVKVWRTFGDQEISSSLSQMVLDPSVRGSMFDQVVVTGSQDTAPQNSNSSSGSMSGSSGGASGQQGMGGATAAGGGAGASGAMGKGGAAGASGAAGKSGGAGASGGKGGAGASGGKGGAGASGAGGAGGGLGGGAGGGIGGGAGGGNGGAAGGKGGAGGAVGRGG